MSDLTRVLSELEDVQNKLLELPDDAVSERLDLHERRARLREEAERLRHGEEGEETTEELRRRLARLEARRDEILARRVGQDPRSPLTSTTTGQYPSEAGEAGEHAEGSGPDRIHLPQTDQWLLEDRRLEEQIVALRKRLADAGEDDQL